MTPVESKTNDYNADYLTAAFSFLGNSVPSYSNEPVFINKVDAYLSDKLFNKLLHSSLDRKQVFL